MLNETSYAVRYVMKMFRQETGSTLVTILTLALAIAANAAIFGVMLALFWAPAGIEKPDQLVTLARTLRGRVAGSGSVSYPNYVRYRNQTDVFTSVAAFSNGMRKFGLRTRAGAEEVPAVLVSGNYFDTLGIKPRLGRFFSPADEQEGALGSAVVSHRLWVSSLGADPELPSKRITLNGIEVPVIGVAPEGFHGADIRDIDIWIPLTSTLTNIEGLLQQSAGWLNVVGRLKPELNPRQAQAKLDIVSGQQAQAESAANRNAGVEVLRFGPLPAGERIVVQAFFTILMVAAGLVLLIACANIAGIGLARASVRKREIAVRLALGAARRRVLRQLLIETFVLFAIAAGIGVAIAQSLDGPLDHLRFQLPVRLAPLTDASTHLPVLIFTLVLTAVAAAVSGLTPALYGTPADISTALKEDSTTVTRRSRLRGGLVVVQVALSFVLLFGGGLFLRTLMSAASADLGFDPARVWIASMDFTLGGVSPAKGEQLERDLLSRLASLPGVESASFALDLPMDLNAIGLGGVNVAGHDPPRGQQSFPALWNVVSPGYFKTLKIPILRGREFNETDREGSLAVAIVNETMATQFWKGKEAIGQIFHQQGQRGETRPIQVIGVARNVNSRVIREEPAPFVYVPYSQGYESEHQLIIRVAAGAEVLPAVRRIIQEADPNLPVTFRTMDEIVGFGLLPQRLAAWLASVMGLAGTILAALGVYGVTSFAVNSRTREIGIRIALGAHARQVRVLVVREGMVLAVVGIGLGIVGALALAQAIEPFVYISPTDNVAFAAAAAVLIGAALLACYFPSRRATLIDPLIALRHE
jgi:predicted permease